MSSVCMSCERTKGMFRPEWNRILCDYCITLAQNHIRLVNVFRITDLRGTVHEVRWTPHGLEVIVIEP